ncbi:MAG: ABC-type dipeptide/oligopeptide/nickel transport system, permease component [Verrucomicrobiaceae bacterium]|nr:ABC-type dipeptide/oligopeptide/nickel transport system, permease component [Verrucomicrobiaceae bacterium]
MNTQSNIPAELFEPAVARPTLDVAVASALPFWPALRRQLRSDARAIVSLLVIFILVIAAVAGRGLWPLDPAQQILGSAAQGSMRAQRALVVRTTIDEPIIELSPAALLPAPQLASPQHLQVLEATTERVKFRWKLVAGAHSYRIYRNTHAPRDHADLGLPLGFTTARGQVSFSDGLLLRPRDYFYSVVASDGADEAKTFATLTITPQPAIGLLEAQLQGLVAADVHDVTSAPQTVLLPAHPLGTDHLGRDLLARLLQGARVSLFIAISAALLYVALGLVYGAVAGFAGGAIDHWMMRIADFVIALPFLLFMILLRIAFGIAPGESGVMPLVIALVLLSWPSTARLVRGQVLQLREEPYISAAQLAGAGNLYIIFRHLLPNMLGVILVTLAFAIPNAIFTEAFLSFIGMGVTPPATSWGAMSSDGVQNLLIHPTELIWPALCISVTVLAFNLLGDALRDALDMKVQR